MKRSAYMKHERTIELDRAGITIWGYGRTGKYVCRLHINATGLAAYKGKKGGKRVADVSWEDLVKQLSK